MASTGGRSRFVPVATRARVCASTREASLLAGARPPRPCPRRTPRHAGLQRQPDTEGLARRGPSAQPLAGNLRVELHQMRGGEVRKSCDDPLTLVAGVDACRGGWIAVVLDADQFAGSISTPTFVELLGSVPDAGVVGVDIPIGLPSERVRAADVAARVFVRPRRSSVFPTPPRAALVAATYAEARGVSRSRSARRSSKSRRASRSAWSKFILRSRSPPLPADRSATRSGAGTDRWNGGGCSPRRASNCRTS